MSEIIVKTKEELKAAKEKGYDSFIVVGDLANDLKKAKAIKKLSKPALVVLTAGIVAATATAPPTAGLSYAMVAPIAASVGITDVSFIAVVAGIGIVLCVGLFAGYNIVFKVTKDGGIEAHFTKKHNKKTEIKD